MNLHEQADRECKTGQPTTFSSRTIKWFWIIAITVVAMIGAMDFLSGWLLGSSGLLVASTTGLIFLWFVLRIIRSRGKFRLMSLFAVCTIVAILSSTLIPRMRTASVHRRLMTAALKGGGSMQLSTQQQRGLPMSRSLRSFLSYFEYSEISDLHLPSDMITDELAKNISLSNEPGFGLILNGEYRDYQAIDRLINKANPKVLRVECKNILATDAQFLAGQPRAVEFLFSPFWTPNLSPIALQRAIDARPSNITIVGPINLDRLLWNNTTLNIDHELKLRIYNPIRNEEFFKALGGNSVPLTLFLNSFSLSDLEWSMLSKLNLCELHLDLCFPQPSEEQFLRLLRMKNLRSLDVSQTNIDDHCWQEFSKIGTLEHVRIDSDLSLETIHQFLQNNPHLADINYFSRAELEKLRGGLGLEDWRYRRSKDWTKLP